MEASTTPAYPTTTWQRPRTTEEQGESTSDEDLDMVSNPNNQLDKEGVEQNNTDPTTVQRHNWQQPTYLQDYEQ